MKPFKNRPCHAEADKMISFLLRKMPSEKPGGHNGKLENFQVFFCSFFFEVVRFFQSEYKRQQMVRIR